MLQLINKVTGEVIAEVITNHSMSIEDVCNLMHVKLQTTQEDVEQGNGYDIDELELVAK